MSEQSYRRTENRPARESIAEESPAPGLVWQWRIWLGRQARRLYLSLNRHTGGWLAILKDAYVSFQEDECTVRAAAIAYRALFSIFPFVFLLFALSTSLLAKPEIRNQVVEFILRNLQAPGLAARVIEQANEQVTQILDRRGLVLALSLVGLLWGGSGVFSTIDSALNVAWKVRRHRPFWRSQVIGLGIALVVTVLFLLSVAATAVISASQLLPTIAAILPLSDLFNRVITLALPFVLSFTMFVALYRLLPYTPVSRRSVTLGALTATILWQTSNYLYSLYVVRLTEGRYGLVYGFALSVIVFLIWIYLSSIILLIGAELAAAYSRHRDVPRQRRLPSVS